MNIQPVLLFCFLSVLQDGNIGLINAEIPIYTRTEGESITATCYFETTGSTKSVCKDECEEDFLTMDVDSVESGRFRMDYVTTTTGSLLDVTITQLRKSDSGHYRCDLDSYGSGPYKQFGINVTDALTTTTQGTTTSSSKQAKTTAGGSGGILYLAVPMTVVISVTVAVSVTVVVLLAVFLPLLYKWKKRSSNDVNSRGHLTNINMESVVYDNCVPVSTLGESGYDNPSFNYENLNPATMSPDHTYATIGQKI